VRDPRESDFTGEFAVMARIEIDGAALKQLCCPDDPVPDAQRRRLRRALIAIIRNNETAT